MKNSIILTEDGMFRLLKKYGIVLVILDIINRFGIIKVLRIFQKYYPLDDLSKIEDINNIVIALTTLFLNLIVGFILLSDLDRRKSLTWILFFWTLLNPWTSLIFFLIWKTIEIKKLSTTNAIANAGLRVC